jgi:hypothetical protein
MSSHKELKLQKQIDYMVDWYSRQGLHAPRCKDDESSFEEGRAMRRGEKTLPGYAECWDDVMLAGGWTYEDRQIRMRKNLDKL